ncbi:MAG: NAD-dependent epimerase/dehydratase family protein [Gammaproteobacteria bacterium]|nr:NAD-dependent epimerase/dehydratase family protein [Gammaproteobacteria bacterium]
MAEKILISGASGFIAGHCIVEMLNHGYAVRGTVRDEARADKLKSILAPHTEHIDRLEFASANLLDADSWLTATEGCDGILHVASPVPVVQPKDADEVIRPARQGTLNVLTAAREHGIERIVLTSSTAAVMSSNRTSGAYTSEDWTDLTRSDLSPYIRSKTEAERAAWEFARGKRRYEAQRSQSRARAWSGAGGGLRLVAGGPRDSHERAVPDVAKDRLRARRCP